MSSETERAVLMANAAFYDAFAQRNLEAMEAIWARDSPVTCIHPGWEALHGREAVMESWGDIMGGSGSPPISCAKPVVYLYGETASVVCIERVPGGTLIASNVFVREHDRWRIVHHHAGPVARSAAPPEEPTPPRMVH